jgi:hypothetical protein
LRRYTQAAGKHWHQTEAVNIIIISSGGGGGNSSSSSSRRSYRPMETFLRTILTLQIIAVRRQSNDILE